MPANEDSGTKAPEGKSKASGKKPKRSSSDKAGDNTKAVSGSGNDATTQRCFKVDLTSIFLYNAL